MYKVFYALALKASVFYYEMTRLSRGCILVMCDPSMNELLAT
jgi:hypothetical protein